jgi:5'-AMP-activated protein kinase regulatory beta subunit
MKGNLTTCLSNRLSPSSATALSTLTLQQLKSASTIVTSVSRTTTTEHGVLASPVRFEFFSPTARRVYVAGSFNDWNPSATPLAPLSGGKWLRHLWLPPGQYEYLFLADGVWFFDPHAPDYVPNVYGTLNAEVEVAASGSLANGNRIRTSPAVTRPKPRRAHDSGAEAGVRFVTAMAAKPVVRERSQSQ